MTIKINREDVTVIVLTHNAGDLWDEWIHAVQQQSIIAGKYLVIDSCSQDQTVLKAKQAEFDVAYILPIYFNHGGTRQLALDFCPDSRFVVYLTQDAILKQTDSLEKLLSPFKDKNVAQVYGRHIPRQAASLIEQHARHFTYPPKSERRTKQDLEQKGYKAAFSSDVYAAYRVSALRSIGGFPQNVIVSEDSYVTTRLLQAGWEIEYAAESKVEHSHAYNLKQLFQRYFDIGVFHQTETSLFASIGHPESEGMNFLKSQVAWLFKHNKALIIPAMCQTLIKFIAYKTGKKYPTLPRKWLTRLSAQKAYWKQNERLNSTSFTSPSSPPTTAFKPETNKPALLAEAALIEQNSSKNESNMCNVP